MSLKFSKGNCFARVLRKEEFKLNSQILSIVTVDYLGVEERFG
jgi:hypothetical protein